MDLSETKLIAMFIDLVDSTKNAESLSQIDYVQKVLLPYQKIANDLKVKFLEPNKIKAFVKGDEVFSRYYDKEYSEEILFNLIDYYIFLKLLIYFEDFNLERINSSRTPIDIGCGINVGTAIIIKDIEERVEGYTINKTKRIEGLSREGKDLKIVVSHSVKLLLEKSKDKIIIFSNRIDGQGKGISSNLEVYEIKEYYSDNLFKMIKDYFLDNINEKIRIWEEAADKLSFLSAAYNWMGNLLCGYKFFRFIDKNDFGLLNITCAYIKNNPYLKNYLIPLFILGSLELSNKKYEKAYIYFDKCYKISKLKKIRIPRLIAAGELIKKNFFSDNNLLLELKKDFIELYDEDISSDYLEEQLKSLKDIFL